MNKLRIAIICDSFPPDACGGIGTSCFNLFMGLKKNGFETKVFTIAGGGKAGISADIIRLKFPRIVKWVLMRIVALWIKLRLGNAGQIYQFGDFMLGTVYGARLNRTVKSFSPDILIVPDKGISILLMKMPKNCKVIFVSHHNPMRFVGEPLIGQYSILDATLAVKWQQKTLKHVSGVICPSSYMKEMFNKTYSFSGPIEVMGNIADIESIAKVVPHNLHEIYKIQKDAPIVYIPSAGSLVKGSAFVFEIVRRIAGGNSGVVGFYLSGNIGPDLKRLLEFSPSNTVLIMPGRISYQENIAYVKGSSLCISPTILENFGMSILEAQACALPCVTFAVGGNSEIIEDGVSGYLVPFLDVEALISKAAELLQDNPLCSKMALSAETRAFKLFDTDRLIGKYIDYFNKISVQCFKHE